MSRDKIHLTYISPYPPNSGGLSTYTKRFVDHLKEREDVAVRIIPLNSFLDIRKLFRLGNPDIVRLEFNIPAYGLNTVSLFFIILVHRLFTPIKFVVNYHEVSRETEMLGILGRVFYLLFSSLFRHIYVHTEQAKNILVTKCWINPTKITTIAHGTTIINGDARQPSETHKKFGLDERKIILTFGFIHQDKGLEYLLKALAILKKNNQSLYAKIQVVIAGDVRSRNGIFTYFQNKDYVYKERLLELKRELKIEDAVTFVSYVEPIWVKSLLNIAHISVLPYINVEQSGVLNLLIPTGIPIIASNIGGLGETLRTTGVLVQPRDEKAIADQIRRLISDKAYYVKIKNSYTNLEKKLHISLVAEQFIQSLGKI